METADLSHHFSRRFNEDLERLLQEGLAFWVAARANGEVTSYGGPLPDPDALLDALSLTYAQYHDSERARDIDQATAWLASYLLP
jgi:hypothetical protein